MLTDTAVFQKSLSALPLKIFQAGETVLAAGSKTGQLLILRKGLVAVIKDGVETARVTDPGAVFGELSALLNQPHSAEGADILAVSRCRRSRSTARPHRAPLRCSHPGNSA